jgi:hydrogenase/urease accessory protein HupE
MRESRIRLRFRHSLVALAFVSIIALILPGRAGAHPEGFSGLRVRVANDAVHVALTLHTRDMGDWFPPAKHPDYVADVCRSLAATAGDLVDVQFNDKSLPLAASAKTWSPEVGMIEVDLAYPPPRSAGTMTVWSKHLAQLPRGHQQLLTVEDARGGGDPSSLYEATLSVEQDAVVFDVPAPAIAPTTQPTLAATPAPRDSDATAAPAPRVSKSSRISFFQLGIEHIVTGYDHLLFLAALLLVCRNFREAASVITFFTVAHSITLTLAALDVVRLPARVVEPAIAASIIYVGVENLTGSHRLLWRAAITFGFGLVHGLGFASALREVGLGSTSIGIAWPLVKFSVGLETGQLVIAAMVLQVMLALRRYRPQAFERKWVPSGSVAVACVGGYWLVLRVLGG